MIILDGYASAIFFAKEECVHKDRKPWRKLSPFKYIDDTCSIDGKDVTCQRVVSNPEYEPYNEGELEKIEQEENEMIYKYLKEKHPDKDYAEKFKSHYCNKM